MKAWLFPCPRWQPAFIDTESQFPGGPLLLPGALAQSFRMVMRTPSPFGCSYVFMLSPKALHLWTLSQLCEQGGSVELMEGTSQLLACGATYTWAQLPFTSLDPCPPPRTQTCHWQSPPLLPPSPPCSPVLAPFGPGCLCGPHLSWPSYLDLSFQPYHISWSCLNLSKPLIPLLLCNTKLSVKVLLLPFSPSVASHS